MARRYAYWAPAALAMLLVSGCGDSGDPKPIEGVVIEHNMGGEHDHHGHGSSSSTSYSSLPASVISPEGDLQDHGLTPSLPRPPSQLDSPNQ